MHKKSHALNGSLCEFFFLQRCRNKNLPAEHAMYIKIALIYTQKLQAIYVHISPELDPNQDR